MNILGEIPSSDSFLRTASTIVLWVAIFLIVCLFWLWRDTISSVGAFFAPYVDSAEASVQDPDALLLASLENGTRAPSEKEIALFDLLLTNLQASCKAESRAEITRALVSARREAFAREKKFSFHTAIPLIRGALPQTPPGSGSCVVATEAYATLVSL